MDIHHSASITETPVKDESPKQIIAYRGKETDTVYIPCRFGLKEVWVCVEEGKLRVYTESSCITSLYYPIYEGDAEFTITIK